MRNTIFIGNGINRLDTTNPCWKKILSQIDESYDFPDNVPNTLQYEDKIISKYDNGTKDSAPTGHHSIEFCEKKKLSQTFKKYQTNKIYEDLVAMHVQDYITTNYDHALDQAIIKAGFIFQGEDQNESRFSIHRYRTYINANGEQKRIWAIHGDYVKPRSILLGYEQYGGQLRKIGEYLNGQYTMGKNKIPNILNRIIGTGIESVDSWVDLFFCSNIFIVGFGMPYDEIDLWWLLCKRKKLILEHPDIFCGNQIVYYEPDISAEKRKILKDLSVFSRSYKKEDEYIEVYLKILADLRKDLSGNWTRI